MYRCPPKVYLIHFRFENDYSGLADVIGIVKITQRVIEILRKELGAFFTISNASNDILFSSHKFWNKINSVYKSATSIFVESQKTKYFANLYNVALNLYHLFLLSH